MCNRLLHKTVDDRRDSKISEFPLFRFRYGYPFHRRGAIFPRQDRTRQLAGVVENVPPKFFGCHSVHTRSPFVGFDAFERQRQVLAAQYRLECDLRKSGLVLCGVFHFHHGRCALLSSSLHSVDTQTQAGFFKFSAPCDFVSTAPYSYEFSPSAGTALPTMTSADYSRQALLRGSIEPNVRESSPGKNVFFPTMYLLHLHLRFRVALGFILNCRLTHLRMPDAVPVRKVSGLPPASFRFRLATDTLAIGYALGATPCARDFHPLEHAHAGRTIKKKATISREISWPYSIWGCVSPGADISSSVRRYGIVPLGRKTNCRATSERVETGAISPCNCKPLI